MKNIKGLILLCLGLFVVGCEVADTNGNIPTAAQLEKQYEHRIDAPITFADDEKLLDLDTKEKEDRYQALDEIVTNYQGNQAAQDYSQIELIDSELALTEILDESSKSSQVIYFGFDECHYCKAFVPKINQIAKELGVTIHYYNTDAHQEDVTFQNIIETYEITTVPRLYIVKDGVPTQSLNHHSSMADIEDFFKTVTQD